MENNNLAENKLLILYTLKDLKFELSKDQLSDLLLGSFFINYFDLQNYIEELRKGGYLKVVKKRDVETLTITQTGIEIYNLFSDRIKSHKKTAIDNYIRDNLDKLIRETTISTSIHEGEKGSYIVKLSALEDDTDLISISMNVPSKEMAEKAIHKWRSDSSAVYSVIYNMLLK